MRCKSCNEIMTDYDCTVRSVFTGEYIGLCKHCMSTIKNDVVGVGNINLMSELDDVDENEDRLDEDPFGADAHNDRYYDR